MAHNTGTNRTRQRRRIGKCFGLLLSLAVVAACGGGESPTAPTPVTPTPPPASVTVTARASSGLQAATVFAFSAQTTNLTAGAVTYRWDFGDGATSTDAAPTRVFSTAGRYTVVLTASDGRQSARAETVVTVHALTGGWISSTGRTTMQLTQSGTAVTGTVSLTASVEGNAFPNCPISGSVRADAPVVVLIRPVCRHATLNLQLVQGEFRMDLDAEGQALSGTITEPAPYGTNPANFRRQ